MPETTARSEAKPLPSATVMVVRDGADGVEVFMLVRNRQVDFASGALVFPGGKVDAQDVAPRWAALARGAGERPERSYWVAALRETFEETGLLIADRGSDGLPVEANIAARITSADQFRVARSERAFADVLDGAGLVLGVGRLQPFAHWITPVTMPKRFDTHFFLAEAPVGQNAIHDGGETIESVWIAPRQALAEGEVGKRVLVPATSLNLEKLATARNVADAFRIARATPIVAITPTVAKVEGGVRISIPSNAGYQTTTVFVPRPSPA
jgi:8-oxo-dGTP pyrophosphatase MutT (NUDIX family)